MADTYFNPWRLNPDAHEFSPQNCQNSTQDPKGAARPREVSNFQKNRRSVSLDSGTPQQNSDLPMTSFKNGVGYEGNGNLVLNSFFALHGRISQSEMEKK